MEAGEEPGAKVIIHWGGQHSELGQLGYILNKRIQEQLIQ